MSTSTTVATNLGPLEPILDDPEVTEILVDGPDRIYVERRGKLEDVDGRFDDAEHLLAGGPAVPAPPGGRGRGARPILRGGAGGGGGSAPGIPACVREGT